MDLVKNFFMVLCHLSNTVTRGVLKKNNIKSVGTTVCSNRAACLKKGRFYVYPVLSYRSSDCSYNVCIAMLSISY